MIPKTRLVPSIVSPGRSRFPKRQIPSSITSRLPVNQVPFHASWGKPIVPLLVNSSLRPCRPSPTKLPSVSGYATFTSPNQADAVSRLSSSLDTSSREYRENHAQMTALIAKMNDLTARIRQGGSPAAREKHLSRGKMLPRDRITALCDPGTTFLEVAPYAGHELYPDATGGVPAGGLIAGVGTVEGVRCMVVANDSTVKGGTYFPITVKKHLRAQEIARDNRLPCLYLVDSGGAHLPHQAHVFPDREHFGRIFYQQARMSSEGIPQIAVVMGPCTAGGAYVPAMSDESIIVEKQGHIFLAGPPLVKAATGEVVTHEELGGGQMHSSVSGVTDYLAVDDAHALVLARRCVANLNYPPPRSSLSHDSSSSSTASFPTASPSRKGPVRFEEPVHDAEELLGLASTNLRKPLPIREVIARTVDGSRFAEFKRDFGTTLVTGFAHIYGHRVGVIANDGILFASAAVKGAHFIELCSQRNIPLVFLQNISGFMVGPAAERDGIAKHGAKLVTAVACANVPKLTVIVGGSYGAGNYGMCGRAYSPRFLWMWPNARIGVMGSEQLTSVMETVGGGDASKTQALKERMDRESEALYSSARLWDDGVIPPPQTRHYLGTALDTIQAYAQPQPTKFGVFRM